MKIKIRRLYKLPKFFIRYLRIKQQDINVKKSSNLFIGGIAGRVGTTWLMQLLKDVTKDKYLIIGEHGVFALSQIRYASLDYYQHHSGRNHFLKYLYKYSKTFAYNRRLIYGAGLEGFKAIVPKRAIKLSFSILRDDLKERRTLEEINICFGRFYSNILNYHALLKKGTLNWINKEPCYGRYISDLYNIIPDCKVVVLTRDGRDTALSMVKRGWYNSNLIRCIDIWKMFAEMTFVGLSKVPSQNYLIIKYEDLISDFKNVMIKILIFYGLDSFGDYVKNIDLTQYKYNPKNMNINKWEKEFTQDETSYFKKTSKDIMKKFGYDI